MSARMRTKRGHRHQELAERYGCNCRRHRGRDVRLDRITDETNKALAYNQHDPQLVRPV